MIGLLINTYNRPQYLEKCIASIRKANLDGVFILVVDDCSTDRRVFQMLNGFLIHRMDQNKSIRYTLEVGYDFLFGQGCDIVINLDADAIVHPDFVPRLVELHKQFPDKIITGFNSLVIGRHPIFEQHPTYCVKKSCGGINMLVTKQMYNQVVLPALKSAQKSRGHWDDVVSEKVRKSGGTFICTTPSVVQHIGFNSAMGHHANPDYAHDFEGDQPSIPVYDQINYFGSTVDFSRR